MSAHIQQMPRYRRHRESQPNPEAETGRAYPRVHIRPRLRSPRNPTAQDYEDSPGPATATSPHEPTTPTHVHSSAQSHGPPMDSGRSAGPTRSSGSYESGPGQSPPLRAWSTGPQGVGGGLPPPAGGGEDATCRMGSHAGRCAPHPVSPRAQPPRARGPPVCPEAPAGDPPGDANRRQAPLGHHPKPNPTHKHPLTTPQASAHRHRQHPQHPGSPARHTARPA